jgi:hypothetical protein
LGISKEEINNLKNRVLAIFGILSFIMEVVISVASLEVKAAMPLVTLIALSGIATAAFIIMAAIRLWKEAKGASLLLVSSAVVIFILLIIRGFISPSYGSSLVILLNIIKVIYSIVFIWVVSLLWIKAKQDRLAKKLLKDSRSTTDKISLTKADSQKADHESVEQLIALPPKRYRGKIKKPTGLDFKDSFPEIGQEFSWSEIVHHTFRVIDFDKNGTKIGPNNQVIAKSKSNSYGYLLVESPIIRNFKVRLPIIHKDDFLIATYMFDHPELGQLIMDKELLVTYAPKDMFANGLPSSPHHVLHYAITPLRSLDSYYSINNNIHMTEPNPQKLFGKFVYQGAIKLQSYKYIDFKGSGKKTLPQ